MYTLYVRGDTSRPGAGQGHLQTVRDEAILTTVRSSYSSLRDIALSPTHPVGRPHYTHPVGRSHYTHVGNTAGYLLACLCNTAGYLLACPVYTRRDMYCPVYTRRDMYCPGNIRGSS